MSANNVILAKKVQVSKIKFSAPKTLNNGSRTVYVNYEGDKLTIQTPLVSLPYGVGDYNDKVSGGDKKTATEEPAGPKKYDLHISFRGMEDNPGIKALHDKMLEIEKHVKDTCFENRLTWMRDDYDGIKAVVDRLGYPIIKLDKDKDTGKVLNRYPPTMKLKLPYDSNTDAFTFECCDMDGNEIDFRSIMTKLKGARARLIIQLGGLWFAGGKYGCTWKVVKARFESSAKANVDFVEDSDDEGPHASKEVHSDEDVEEDAMAHAASPVTTKKPVVKAPPPTVVPEESDEDEPVPVKKPTKVKEPTPEPEEDPVEEDVEPEEDVEEEPEEEDVPPPPPAKTKATAKKPVIPEPEEDDDVDSEFEELPPPPKPAAKKTTTSKKK